MSGQAFEGWLNHRLEGGEVKDIFQDRKDGLVLIQLLGRLSSRPLGSYSKNPKLKMSRLKNLG